MTSPTDGDAEGDIVDRWLDTEITTLRSAGQSAERRSIRTGAIVTPALETLRRHAAGTAFYDGALNLLKGRSNPGAVLIDLADLLEVWRNYRRSGLAGTASVSVQARIAAATDLMEQVQQLLDDPGVHVAAPVVLAGAALEEALRSLVLDLDLKVIGQPGLQSYAEALRRAERFAPQDVKDVNAWAGQRNDAAHGRFEGLSRDRAQVMVDGINLFIRQRLPPTSL